jgi:hypothetical protein
MKNIHLIPTDKPSRLALLHDDKLHIGTSWKKDFNVNPQNIYITSDEEIKEGDWFLWQGYGGEWFKEKCEYMLYEGKKTKHLNCHYKTQFKVILTTDTDLIKDGVQAITDEFLEWFVKNPSCERVVKVIKNYLSNDGQWKDVLLPSEWEIDTKIKYKIIIPQEKNKQMDEKGNLLTYWGGLEKPKQETQGYICPQTQLQCDDECCVSAEDCHIDAGFINLNSDTVGIGKFHTPKSTPKQETLEEAADKIFFNCPGDITKSYAKKKAIELAKWQQEQDKNKYSEEEVRNIVEQTIEKFYKHIYSDKTKSEMKELWFEQFKKK